MFSSVWSEYLAWNEGVRRFKSCNTDQYKNKRSVAQSGSASALGAEGRRFDPCRSDQKDYRHLAQSGRALFWGDKGRRFKSGNADQIRSNKNQYLAQLGRALH